MANPNAGHFFQTSESLVAEQRKASKAQNKLGRPIKLSSKLLAVTADPFDTRAVYVAEAAGEVRRVVLEVSFGVFPSFLDTARFVYWENSCNKSNNSLTIHSRPAKKSQ
jgi:hypothetical protein